MQLLALSTLSLILLRWSVAFGSLDCSLYTQHEDTYLICRIFQNITVPSTGCCDGWFDLDSTNANVTNMCDWTGGITSYITCSDVPSLDASETYPRLTKFTLPGSSSGTVIVSPAEKFPFPPFLQRLVFGSSASLHAEWGNFSNLPHNQSLTYLDVGYTEISGTVAWETLPRTLTFFDVSASLMKIGYSDLSGMPPNLEQYETFWNSIPSDANTSFDWNNLPDTMKQMRITAGAAITGPIDMSNHFPSSLEVLRFTGTGGLGSIVLPTEPNPNLKSLQLVSNALKMDIGELNFSLAFPNLETLLLERNAFNGTLDFSNLPASLITFDISESRLYGNYQNLVDVADSPYHRWYAKNMLTNVEKLALSNVACNCTFDDFWELIPFNASKVGVFVLEKVSFAQDSLAWNLIETKFENCTLEESSYNTLQIQLSDMAWSGSLNLEYFPSTTYNLFLNDNNFEGDFTPHMEHLTQLNDFRAYGSNYLDGTVNWSTFSTLESLTILWIDTSPLLTGTINFAALPSSLESIYLDNCNFHGGVSNFSHLVNLGKLHLQNNNLNGKVSWSDLSSMSSLEFYFYGNKLTGDIDLSVIDSSNLGSTVLRGYSNNFNGTINLDKITSNIQELYFYDNNIQGGVDFGQIDNSSESSSYPRVWLDENVYCTSCPDLTDLCYVDTWQVSDRVNPNTGYCSGQIACEDTCRCDRTPCPSTDPTDAPSRMPSDVPSVEPSAVPTFVISTSLMPSSSIITTLAFLEIASTDSITEQDDEDTTNRGWIEENLVVMVCVVAASVCVVCICTASICLILIRKYKKRIDTLTAANTVAIGTVRTVGSHASASPASPPNAGKANHTRLVPVTYVLTMDKLPKKIAEPRDDLNTASKNEVNAQIGETGAAPGPQVGRLDSTPLEGHSTGVALMGRSATGGSDSMNDKERQEIEIMYQQSGETHAGTENHAEEMQIKYLSYESNTATGEN